MSDSRPGQPEPTDTGFLSQGRDGRLRFGAGCVRGWPWVLDDKGIAEEVPAETLARGLVVPRSYEWSDVVRAGLRLRPTVSVPLLLRPWRDFEYRLEVRTADGKGWFMYQHHLLARTEGRGHARALPALVQYLLATPEARACLAEDTAVAELVDAVRECLARTEAVVSARGRWSEASRRRRRELDAAAVEMLAARGVVLFGGRPVRGGRLEATPEMIDAVIVDWADHVAGDLPSDTVVAAAIDAMQGPRPDWPFDVLTGA